MRGVVDLLKDGVYVAVIGSAGAGAILLLIWALGGCGGQQQPDWGAVISEVATEGIPEITAERCEGAPPAYRLSWRRELKRWGKGPRGRALRLEGELRLIEECRADEREED